MAAQAPFTFGRVPERDDFVDREREREVLARNFNALVNTVVISPRRWGKTSLVEYTAREVMAADKRIKVVLIDTFNARNEAEFFAALATGVLKATTSKFGELMDDVGKFLGHLRPKVTLSPDAHSEFTLDLDWDEAQKNPNEILDLAEQLATAKKLKLVVCIDEFQAVAQYPESLAFQRQLRAHWQRHSHVAYCLYGSRRHLLLDLVTDPDKPFYRFGDVFQLGKIPNPVWADFVVKRFADTGKVIGRDDASLLATLVDNHPYYVQQLAQQTWFRTSKRANEQTVRDALDGLRDQLGLQFVYLIGTLSDRQVRLLGAIILGETALSSRAVIDKFKLGTSAGVTQMKDALEKREVIETIDGHVELLDPLFKYWLTTVLFVNSA
jgi:hypothetical protein